jgi:hypothetical protein
VAARNQEHVSLQPDVSRDAREFDLRAF